MKRLSKTNKKNENKDLNNDKDNDNDYKEIYEKQPTLYELQEECKHKQEGLPPKNLPTEINGMMIIKWYKDNNGNYRDIQGQIHYRPLNYKETNDEMNDDEEFERSRFIPAKVRYEVYLRDGGKCVMCGCSENIQFDHIIPFDKGGAHSLENIQLLCKSCNLKKSNKLDI